MKKILSLLLVIVLTLGMSSGVFADESQVQLVEKTTYLTYEQYTELLATEKGITLEEAIALDKSENEAYEKELVKRFPKLKNKKINSNNSISPNGITADGYYYVNQEWGFVYPGNTSFQGALTASFKNYSYGSFREIVTVLGKSTRRTAGLYSATWVPNYIWQYPENTGMPAASVELGGSGYFQIVTTISGGISGGVPGFEITASSESETIYQSQSVFVEVVYSLY